MLLPKCKIWGIKTFIFGSDAGFLLASLFCSSAILFPKNKIWKAGRMIDMGKGGVYGEIAA